MSPLTLNETLKKLDFPVKLMDIKHEGQDKIIPGRKAVVRTDTMQTLNIVTDKYKLVPHIDVIHEPLEILVKQGFSIENIKMAKNGAFVKAVVKDPTEMTVVGDKFFKTFSVINSYDSTHRLQVLLGVMRLICTNGAAILRKGFRFGAKHYVSMSMDTSRLTEFIKTSSEGFKIWEKDIEYISKKPFGQTDYIDVLNDLKVGDRMHDEILAASKLDINRGPGLYGLYNGYSYVMSRKGDTGTALTQLRNDIRGDIFLKQLKEYN